MSKKSINIQKIIQSTIDYESKYHGNNAMIHICDGSEIEFLKFCNKLSTHTFIDAIGGNKSPENCRRYRTDLIFDDIIDKLAETKNIGCGLKTYHKHQFNWFEWEQWNGGYIECFIRCINYDNDYHDIIVWQYIKMEHLETILTKFITNSGIVQYNNLIKQTFI